MRLFGLIGSEESPVEAAEQSVRVKQERRDRLVTQLADAQRWLDASRTEAANIALEHGAALLEDQTQNIASQQAGAEALKTALGRAEAELIDAQFKFAHEQDQAERAELVAEIERLQADLKHPTTQLLAIIDDLVPLLKRAANLTPDASGLAGLVEAWHIELPAAFQVLTTALNLHAGGIRDGRVRAQLPSVAETKPAERPAPPPEVSIFPLHDITWVDGRGQQRTGTRYWDQGVPELTAQRAIAAGVVVLSSSDEARKLRSKRGGLGADLDRLVNLDQDNPQPPPAQPERWLNPNPQARWGDAQRTSAPLSSWIGRPTNTPTNTEGF